MIGCLFEFGILNGHVAIVIGKFRWRSSLDFSISIQTFKPNNKWMKI